MTDEQKERERALAHVLDEVVSGLPRARRDCCVDAINALSNCVPVPRAEYDRLRRALWRSMGMCGYGAYCDSIGLDDLWIEMGFAERDGKQARWTPAAHEFAKEMKAEK